jgi:hypothetical protein
VGVGATAVEEPGGEPFDETMKRLTVELNQQFAESMRPTAAIRANLAPFRRAP